MSHFVLFHWIMIQIFIVHTASQTVIRGVIGQPVQLPCFYQVTRHKDISDMCWGRGPCPNSKCNNKILHTTGNRVTFRRSQRYSLQGYISYGDVSLTIGKVKAEDAGTYCCRIEIPGWFNDIKKNMQLEVVRARPVTTTTTRKAPVSPKSFRKTTFAPQSTSDHHTTAETTVLLTTATPKATSATTDHQTAAETTVLLTTATPKATSAITDHQATAETTVLLMTATPKATSATTDHQTAAETTVLLTTATPKATSAITDHQATAETTVLLTTAVPEATSTTIESPAVISVETTALPTFAVTANDTFPAAIVTTSALPDFPTGFQTTDMRTEDDDVFCSAESVPLPGGTKVTTEFPSAILTAEGIKSAHPSLVVEDMPIVGISSNSDIKDEKHNDNGDKFPSYAILVACVIVVSILFILMLSSLFWKRRHTKKFIIKSLGPVEDIEKVFSDAEGENNIFSL